MNNKFDELTKGLAQSVTRREALKKFSVGLAGMALAESAGRRVSDLVHGVTQLLLPFFLAGIGMHLDVSAFARTPKYRVAGRGEKSKAAAKYRKRLGLVPWLELLIGTYFAATVFYAIDNENFITVPFLVLFVLGYWYTVLMSLLQGRFSALAMLLRPKSELEIHEKPFPVGV